jgi:predicted DNA-binding antitoxin AbrB/MazE fold protein
MWEVRRMTRRVDAVFENGVLRPLEQLEGIAEHARVKVSIDVPDGAPGRLADCLGVLPEEDAAEMLAVIAAEFGRVDPDDWK